MMEPRKGAIARCSLGTIGLITSDSPLVVEYSDGTRGLTWTGVHLEDNFIEIVGLEGLHLAPGDPWSSRTPSVVGYLDEIVAALEDGRRGGE